ncbi:MAG: class I SAM-dependent methyltransferase [Candidatus Aceula meridiana]|nr:class I SAM-dependent methyltransferase [Candidatus Aceula meridiana]
MANASANAIQEHLKHKVLYDKFGYDVDAERAIVIEKVEPIKGKILEVGSGKGYFAIALAQKGYKFTSIDISSQEQQIAKNNLADFGLSEAVNFQVADAIDMPFSDGIFDIVFCVNSFHHMENQFSVLREIIRACKPKATIVINDFNQEGLRLIDSLHKNEGREHKFFNVCWEAMVYFLHKKNFQTQFSETKHQKMLVASAK